MEYNSLKQELTSASLASGLKRIADQFPGEVIMSSSFGQEDMVLLDAICKNEVPIDVFTLDTGRLFQETYDLMDLAKARYKKEIKIFFPEADDVEQYVTKKGANAFYESVANRKECCFIRKVKPLNRALNGKKVWVTGLRASQSANRKDMSVLEWDESFQLYKYNPLIAWTHEDILEYIDRYKVPYNKLHDAGFTSIGCAPCTRAVEKGEPERAGRWWWESSQKECGLHTHDTPAIATTIK